AQVRPCRHWYGARLPEGRLQRRLGALLVCTPAKSRYSRYIRYRRGPDMSYECPHCGQRLLMRYGVGLSPRQADIFDMIERAIAGGGIEMDVLADLMTPGMATNKPRNQIRVHVHQINNKLEEPDYRIIGDRDSRRYQVVVRR